MTEKELKKLNRYQLLELLVMQTERADKLQQKVEELEARLEERDLNLTRLGSVAEAAIQVSGVFESAQKAADLYLDAAKRQSDDMVAYARRKAATIIAQAEANAQSLSKPLQEPCNNVTGKLNANDKEV